MAESFSDTYLEELSISLRDISNRISISQSEIENVFNLLMKNIPFQSNRQLHTCILSLKVFANYVAEVPENATFFVKLVEKTFPIVANPIKETIDVEQLAYFYKIQFILLNNIMTTSKECISKEICNDILDKIFELFTTCESIGIDIDGESIIEILDECQSIVGKIESNKFIILRDMCRCINDEARADGDEDLISTSLKVALKYSCNLDVSNLDENEKIDFFFKLFNDLTCIDDEQVLLNVSYELKIGSITFFNALLDKLFDVNGKLKTKNHILMSLIILSNEITSEAMMSAFLSKVSVHELTEIYFTQIYPGLTLKLPWELQSIVLFNKIPLNNISISDNALSCYINTLTSLITYATLQIRLDVICLQVVFLGKILGSNEDPTQRDPIFNFLKVLKLSNEYPSFPAAFKQSLNQVYFPYLNRLKETPETAGEILKITLVDAYDILEKALVDNTAVQMKYLIELSQIFGFYVRSYGREDWFQRCFKLLETSVEDSKKQVESQIKSGQKELNHYENTAWRVLEDNFKYTEVLLNQLLNS